MSSASVMLSVSELVSGVVLQVAIILDEFLHRNVEVSALPRVATVILPSTVRLATPAPEFCNASVVFAPSTRSSAVVPAAVLESVAELRSIDEPAKVRAAPELPIPVVAVPVVLIVVAPSTVVVDAELPIATVPVDVPVLMLVLKLLEAFKLMVAPEIVAPRLPVSS